ncbi:MAG: hypothetical protein LUD39_04740 [Opitutae bacterium]|nr:hypothetical protein [Opitutae bacterium]
MRVKILAYLLFSLISLLSSGCIYERGKIFSSGERECWRKIQFEKSQFSPTAEMDKVSSEYVFSEDGGYLKNAQTRGAVIYGTDLDKKLTDEGKAKFELEKNLMDSAVEFSFAGEKCIFLMKGKMGYAKICAGEKYRAEVQELVPLLNKDAYPDRLIGAALIPLKHNDMVFLAIVIKNRRISQLYSVYVLDDHFDVVYKDVVSGDVVCRVGALKDGGFYVEGSLSEKGTAYRFK